VSPPVLRPFLGRDLGQVSDFTAAAMRERPLVSIEDVLVRCRPSYALRHRQRFPLSAVSPAVVQAAVSLLANANLTDLMLGVDQTDVDRRMADMLADPAPYHDV
jgi:hypothetical protein